MSMIECKECGNRISGKADVCPYCGVMSESKAFSVGMAGLGMAVMIFGLLMMINGC